MIEAGQDRQALLGEVMHLVVEADRGDVLPGGHGPGEGEELPDEVRPLGRVGARRIDVELDPGQGLDGDRLQPGERVVERKEEGERLESDHRLLDLRARCAPPVPASEGDVELGRLEPVDRGTHASAIAAPELDRWREVTRRLEDPEGRPAALGHQVDEDRPIRLAELDDDVIVQPQQCAGPLEQQATLGRQRHAARRPYEEGSPEAQLEVVDLARQRLLRDEQPRGGSREVQLLGDRDEVAQLPDVEVRVRGRRLRIHASTMLVDGAQVLDCGATRRDG